jgi:flagella basal body P-ring formation protein FlgA
MKRILASLTTLAAALLFFVPVQAAAQNAQTQSPAAVQRAVQDFVRAQTSGIAGHASVSVGAVDPKLALPACAVLDVFTPPGGKLWGNSSVGVRCGAPTPWTIYVSVTVRVQGPYLAAARAIPAGQALAHGDLTVVQGDLTQMPPTIMSDMNQALGKSVTMALAPGQPLRGDVLRVVPAVLQGQTVRVVSQGAGFRVSAEGKAVANAGVGQLAQVRTASGQTVSGIARSDGTVEVSF